MTEDYVTILNNNVQATVLNQVVTVNVSGRLFQTTRPTLDKFQNIKWSEIILDSNHHYFIDRDPAYFEILIDYARYNRWNEDLIRHQDISRILEEVKYYGINTIRCFPKFSISEHVILNPSDSYDYCVFGSNYTPHLLIKYLINHKYCLTVEYYQSHPTGKCHCGQIHTNGKHQLSLTNGPTYEIQGPSFEYIQGYRYGPAKKAIYQCQFEIQALYGLTDNNMNDLLDYIRD